MQCINGTCHNQPGVLRGMHAKVIGHRVKAVTDTHTCSGKSLSPKRNYKFYQFTAQTGQCIHFILSSIEYDDVKSFDPLKNKSHNDPRGRQLVTIRFEVVNLSRVFVI